MGQIIKVESGYRERERKYIPTKKGRLSAILKHVLNAEDEYVTADHPDFIPPAIPKKIRKKILTPREVTFVRERFYFLDEGLKAISSDIEIRQEAKQKYPVKQTVKIGAGGTKENHTLDRVEYPSKLRHFGPNLTAVDDKTARKQLKELFEDAAFIPALRIVSQRTRLSYHPNGDPDIEIEMAFDMILWGQTAFGHTWQEPKVEIELIKGADNTDEAQRILEKEEKRLLSSFPLKPITHSNPSPGFVKISEALEGKNASKNKKSWANMTTRPSFDLTPKK